MTAFGLPIGAIASPIAMLLNIAISNHDYFSTFEYQCVDSYYVVSVCFDLVG